MYFLPCQAPSQLEEGTDVGKSHKNLITADYSGSQNFEEHYTVQHPLLRHLTPRLNLKIRRQRFPLLKTHVHQKSRHCVEEVAGCETDDFLGAGAFVF